MAFFDLKRVSKEHSKEALKKSFSAFGKVKFVFLNDDKFDSNFYFGGVNFIGLNDKNGFENFCQEQKIQCREKEDRSLQGNNTQHGVNRAKKITPPKKESVQITNPSFYFYKDKAYGKDIEDFSLQNSYEELFSINGAQTFELTTTYPGLLVGSGYNHPKLKENKDDFQLGFFFDHTTGLPLISGSSIKGVLRSVFAHPEFIEDVYGKDVTDKLKYIFEEQKVIFYDAFIVKSANEDKKIFGSDYITSHYSDEPNGEFKEPNPIKFLKILPEVSFRFQFRFLEKDDEVYLELFKDIIQDFGLGAKTNTGYGKFIDHVEQNSWADYY